MSKASEAIWLQTFAIGIAANITTTSGLCSFKTFIKRSVSRISPYSILQNLAKSLVRSRKNNL